MARNTSGLRRGGPGRPKGSPNKATKEMAEFFREFFESEDYRESARKRVLAGDASHLENFWHAKLNGKPPEHITHSGEVSMPTRVIFELHRAST